MRTIQAATLLSFLALAASPVVFSCADLTPLASGACGNGVIDANEDCDGADPLCGKPGEAFACRRKCDTSATATSTCPSGWGCGIDGICREPTGTFASAGDSLSSGVFAMQVGDFDGDGRKDILGTSARSASGTSLRFHYFGDDANLVDTKLVAAGAAAPFITDVNADGREDIVFGFNGIAVFQGSANRELLPNVLTSASLPGRGLGSAFVMTALRGALPSGARSSLVGVAKQNNVTTLVSLLDAQPIAELPTDLVGTPAWTSFNPDQLNVIGDGLRSPCGQLVIVTPSKITLAEPGCALAKPSWALTTVDTLNSPGGSTFAGALLGDLNNDRKVDILAVKQTGSGSLRLVAYMNVSGTVPNRLVSANEVDLGPLPRARGQADASDNRALALADLDGNGFADLILPSGVAMALPSAAPAPGDPRAPGEYPDDITSELQLERWTTARIGDMNGDGLPDIIATTGPEANAQVSVLISYRGALGYDATPFKLVTDGEVNMNSIALGDFDGDGTDDLGLISRTTEGDESVNIAFGRGIGAPEPFRTVAKYPYAKGIFAVPVATEGRRRSLYLTAETPGGTTTSIADLATTGDRVSISPLILRGEPKAVTWVPSQLGPGTFMLKNPTTGVEMPTPTVLALARGFSSLTKQASSLFFSRLDATGQMTAAEQVAGKIADCFGGAGPEADKLDPVFALGRLSGNIDAMFAISTQKDNSTLLSAISVSGGTCKATSLGTIAGTAAFTNDSTVRILDVDGDGKSDIVVLLATSPDARTLHVFFGDGTGKVSSPVKVAVPASQAGAQTAGTSVIGYVKVRGKASEDPLFAIATRTKVFMMRVTKDHTFTLAEDLTALANQDTESKQAWLQRGSDIAAGDFDGDGVEDIAIANSGTLRILRQLPVRQ